ncbi:MAG: alpha-amylase family protein [Armatimonadota bacterium]
MISIRNLAISLICFTSILTTAEGYAMQSKDAFIRQDGTSWTFGTSKVERTVALENGVYALESFIDKTDNRDLIIGGTSSEEFAVSLDGESNPVTGRSSGWQLVDSRKSKLKQGELQLDVTLRRESLLVTKSYVIYPGSALIREWVTYKNAGSAPIEVSNPGFLNFAVNPRSLRTLDFHWMTGAENRPGGWKLITEKLRVGKERKFDSYDPFKVESDYKLPGDGINAKIMLNDRQVWPESGWVYSKDDRDVKPFDLTADISAGDKLVFIVNMNKELSCDTTRFDPVITYTDGESHTASAEFSEEQGKDGWRYQYIDNGQFFDLRYYTGAKQWKPEVDNIGGVPFVGKDNQHPYVGQDVARVWTAPKSGKVHITGYVLNTGNWSGPDPSGGFALGSSTYGPWYAMHDKSTGNGLFIGWDYFGHWASSFTAGKDGSVQVSMNVANHKQKLAPGESVTSPKAFVGLFNGDLDDAGNNLLDWQYEYMWDYAREGWFPGVRMLGYWMHGVNMESGWNAGWGDIDSQFRKVFRVADLMRNTGGDVYHRDWGWWDKAGDWNGPDWATVNKYLRKYDMGMLIYAFMYTVDPQSKVAREHPEWLAGGGTTLDMSKPEVVEFIGSQLDGFVEKWGDFEWRNDSNPMAPDKGDDTPLLAQDQGLREIIKKFLDKHPKCAFQPVNGGGQCAGYDYVRYGSSLQYSDGPVGLRANYYLSLLFPPDKLNHMPDMWDPNSFDKATWHGLLSTCFDMTGDTWDHVKLEGLRDMVDVYHYLFKEGVVGRWVKVYRPIIDGDDPVMYFQRMNRDRTKGIIITKHLVPGAVSIKPKGLLPDTKYIVSFHEGSGESVTRTGADLMENGIRLEKVAPGELIYLNMPMHPGSKLDTEPPTAPRSARKQWGANMGYPGVELNWEAAKDNNWISYYEIWRNSKFVDKAAKGTYYFDHSAGADLAARYEIKAVDGAGNVSALVTASGLEATASTIYDDAPGAGLVYTGEWNRESNLQPAHEGTISWSNQKGSALECSIEGKKLLIFTKLGADCGKASVSIDGSDPEMFDTYSADDIWGVCVYSKDLQPGKHTLKIEVTGDRGPDAKDSRVYIDGIRVER